MQMHTKSFVDQATNSFCSIKTIIIYSRTQLGRTPIIQTPLVKDTWKRHSDMVYVLIRTTYYVWQVVPSFTYFCLCIIKLITLFSASTVGYNTIQQQAKYLCSTNALSSIIKNIYTLKIFISLGKLTFSTITENNFYTKWHTPMTVSRTRSLVGPVCTWGLKINLTSHVYMQYFICAKIHSR